MRVYQRPRSKYWWAEFKINGKSHRFSTKRTKQTDARRMMNAEYNRLMDQRQFGEKPEISLFDAMDKTVKSVKGSTQTSYKLSMSKFLGTNDRCANTWFLDPQRKLSTLCVDDLEEHRECRISEGLKPNSVNVEIRFIRRVYNLCKVDYVAPAHLKVEELKGFQKSRTISFEEEAAILAYLEEKIDETQGSRTKAIDGEAYIKARDLFIYLIDTGVRLSEALFADNFNIDLNERCIDNYNFKTDKEVLVPISDRLYPILVRRSNAQKPFEAMSRAVRLLRGVIKENCPSNSHILRTKGAATIHSLRDTYATRMLKNGLQIGEVQTLLGHASYKQTLKYAKFDSLDTVRKAAHMLNKGTH